MGTTFEVIIADSEQSYAGQAARAVFREVDRLEYLFSRFNPSSEISQVNRLRPGEFMRIGLETYECLIAAEHIRAETAGAFDINFRSRLESRSGAGEKPQESAAFSARQETGHVHQPSAFEVKSGGDGFWISLAKAESRECASNLDLDLGGIGKGYALDRALSILADWSIERALIHAGTSTAMAIGNAPVLSPGEKGWPVGVGGAWRSEGAPKRVLLKDRALSGSGTEGKGRHILDPKTGEPAARHLAAWSSHPSAALADALSTAFMIMETEDINSYCERHPEAWALLILPDRTFRVFNKDVFCNTL